MTAQEIISKIDEYHIPYDFFTQCDTLEECMDTDDENPCVLTEEEIEAMFGPTEVLDGWSEQDDDVVEAEEIILFKDHDVFLQFSSSSSDMRGEEFTDISEVRPVVIPKTMWVIPGGVASFKNKALDLPYRDHIS